MPTKKERKNNKRVGYNDDLSPEQNLFRAVMGQAVVDILSKSSRSDDVCYKRRAVEWVKNKNSDFRMVCEFAGYDAQYYYERLCKLIDKIEEQAEIRI